MSSQDKQLKTRYDKTGQDKTSQDTKDNLDPKKDRRVIESAKAAAAAKEAEHWRCCLVIAGTLKKSTASRSFMFFHGRHPVFHVCNKLDSNDCGGVTMAPATTARKPPNYSNMHTACHKNTNDNAASKILHFTQHPGKNAKLPRVSRYPSSVSGLCVSCDIINDDVTYTERLIPCRRPQQHHGRREAGVENRRRKKGSTTSVRQTKPTTTFVIPFPP